MQSLNRRETARNSLMGYDKTVTQNLRNMKGEANKIAEENNSLDDIEEDCSIFDGLEQNS